MADSQQAIPSRPSSAPWVSPRRGTDGPRGPALRPSRRCTPDDQRRIHVGGEEALAAPRRRRNADVDQRTAKPPRTSADYREAYGIHASNGILFNHESPLRGETFLTRKVTRAVAAIHLGLQDRLYLGNLDAKRDWGHAREYVRGMWLMLQQEQPDDYVLATGKTTLVRDFVTKAFSEVGVDIEWRGEGLDELGQCGKTGRTLVSVDPRYFRPTEVDLLLGDPTKARDKLGWVHETGWETLCAEMVASDLKVVASEARHHRMD